LGRALDRGEHGLGFGTCLLAALVLAVGPAERPAQLGDLQLALP
jgi:hypothetical protein